MIHLDLTAVVGSIREYVTYSCRLLTTPFFGAGYPLYSRTPHFMPRENRFQERLYTINHPAISAQTYGNNPWTV